MSEFDRVFNEYEQEVLALIPILEEWWSEIAEVRRGKTDRDHRWPLGFSGHPRFIAIFRKYALRILELNEQLDTEEGASVEELWHRGEEDQEEDRSIRPRSMLIDDFLDRHPEYREQFRMFTFIPLGTLDYAAVYPEE
jgi:hypothetical protein